VVASQARLAGVAHFLANCGPTHGFALFVSHPLKQDVKVEGTRKQTIAIKNVRVMVHRGTKCTIEFALPQINQLLRAQLPPQ
jgi:hypothetical protein